MKPTKLQNDEIVFSGKPFPEVIDVDYLGGQKLYLEFRDGKTGEVDLLPFIENIPALEELKDPKYFTLFSLSHGTIAWGYDREINPRWLYENTH